MRTFEKDPAEKLDYSRDWATKLGTDESIVSSAWRVEAPPDSALVILEDSFDASSATVWVEGGTPGARYELANTITTNLGRRWERSLRLLIKQL